MIRGKIKVDWEKVLSQSTGPTSDDVDVLFTDGEVIIQRKAYEPSRFTCLDCRKTFDELEHGSFRIRRRKRSSFLCWSCSNRTNSGFLRRGCSFDDASAMHALKHLTSEIEWEIKNGHRKRRR